MKILIKNGHVIDPDTKLDQVADVLLEDDKIQEVKENIKDKADRVIDARGCYVMPGLIDCKDTKYHYRFIQNIFFY